MLSKRGFKFAMMLDNNDSIALEVL